MKPFEKITLIAEDCRFWQWLLSSPLSVAICARLHRDGFAEGLILPSQSPQRAFIAESLTQLASLTHAEEIHQCNEELSAEYTAIFVSHQYQVSPIESVWKDEDKLAWQAPMFDMRKIYQQYGLTAKHWRTISEDHLLAQLEFIAYQLTLIAQPQADLPAMDRQTLAEFLNTHINSWLPPFSARIAQATAIPLYASLLMLLSESLQELPTILSPSAASS